MCSSQRCGGGMSACRVSRRFLATSRPRAWLGPASLCAALWLCPALADVDARQILLPVADVAADPVWALFSGEGGFAQALQDLSADISYEDALTTAVLARSGGIGQTLTVRLKSGAPPRGARNGDHIVHVWARAAQPNGATFRVALYEGDVLRWASPTLSATASFRELARVIPQAQARNIVDYQNLRLRFYSQGKPFFLTKAYLEVGEDQAPNLGYSDTPMWGGQVHVLQYELDPLATGVSWVEDTGPNNNTDLHAYCSAVDQQTGRPLPVNGARGLSMGLAETESTPQTGRRSSGSFAVMIDQEGYIVTCDIDEANPAASVVTRWSGAALDPLENDPVARSHRSEAFATKDYTQSHRIVVYQYRKPLDSGAFELYLVDLDQDPLLHVRIWNPPAVPAGRVDALVLSTQRSLDATPYWFWGCYPSADPGTPLAVCRIDLRDYPNIVVRQVIVRPEDVLYGFAFVGSDGKQRWIAGYNPPGTPGGRGDPGLRLYEEAEPLWTVEADYPIDTDLWTPSFAVPGRGQTPEVVGPDDQGRYFVLWSTHDCQDSPGPFALGAYGKIVAAQIGRPHSAVVVSRKQNHQVQTEPEPFILNGKLQVAYSETQTGPLRVPGEGQIQERYIDLTNFPSPQ